MAQSKGSAMENQDPKMLDQCAEICHACQDECLEAIGCCLDQGGELGSRAHQTLLADCAAICGVSHNLLHRHSPQHVITCPACAEVCRLCADACARLDSGGSLASCIEACRRCAESCESMARGNTQRRN